MVVDAEVKREIGKTTLRSEWRGVLKKYLTGPTLLEMTEPTLLEISGCRKIRI